MTYTDAAGDALERIQNQNLPLQTVGSMTAGALTSNYNGAGYYDVIYSYEFTPEHGIDAGGYIVILMSVSDLQLT